MSSAILRKSVTDLSRRKARTFLTTLTLALAVASIGLFAVPALMQQAMDREITTGRLADVTLTTRPVVLSDAQLQRVERLPNVRGVAGAGPSRSLALAASRRRACSRRACMSVTGARRRSWPVSATSTTSRPTS